MASILHEHEQQYSSITAEVTSKTGRIPNVHGGEKRKLISEVERHLEDAKETVEQMELEVRELHPSERGRYQTRVKSYAAEIQQLHKEFKRACIAFSDEQRARDELLNGGEELSTAEDQRQRLLDNSERLERGTRRLEAGYKICVETENIGAEALTNLQTQRESIQRSRDRLREVDSTLGQSSRLLQGMMRRVLQNRVILYAMIAVLLIAIIIVIYFSVV